MTLRDIESQNTTDQFGDAEPVPCDGPVLQVTEAVQFVRGHQQQEGHRGPGQRCLLETWCEVWVCCVPHHLCVLQKVPPHYIGQLWRATADLLKLWLWIKALGNALRWATTLLSCYAFESSCSEIADPILLDESDTTRPCLCLNAFHQYSNSPQLI